MSRFVIFLCFPADSWIRFLLVFAHCIPQLFERSRFANEIGAAIHLSPNANGVLQRLGIDATKFGAVEAELVSVGLFALGKEESRS